MRTRAFELQLFSFCVLQLTLRVLSTRILTRLQGVSKRRRAGLAMRITAISGELRPLLLTSVSGSLPKRA